MVIFLISLVAIYMLFKYIGKDVKPKVLCKRHTWKENLVVFPDGSTSRFLHCEICKMVPNPEGTGDTFLEEEK